MSALTLEPVQETEDNTATAEVLPMPLEEANARFQPLHFADRIRELYTMFKPEEVLITSSFAATSAYFLHIIHRIQPAQKIAFIDTGYHFEQTLAYKDYLSKLYGLEVFALKAEDWKHQFTVDDRTWEKNPDYCCSINKVEPLEAVKPQFKVWVSSLMGWQTDHRGDMDIFETRRGILKFNPMIDVTREERDQYIREHDLPFHPLVAEGYQSIGCTHCTVKGEGRAGRWAGKPKTECGLHL